MTGALPLVDKEDLGSCAGSSRELDRYQAKMRIKLLALLKLFSRTTTSATGFATTTQCHATAPVGIPTSSYAPRASSATGTGTTATTNSTATTAATKEPSAGRGTISYSSFLP